VCGHDGGDAYKPASTRGELGGADATRACGFFAEHAHRMIGDEHSKKREFVADSTQGPVKVAFRATGTTTSGEPIERGDARLRPKELQ
jgi:hypothetical protein